MAGAPAVASVRGRRTAQALCALSCGAALAMAALLKPDPRGLGTHEQLGLPPCSFHRLTGLPCPGCGLTTAFAYAVRLQFGRAFIANPFGMLLSMATAVLAVFSLVCLVTNWRAWSWLNRLENPIVLGSIFALMFAAWGFKLLVTLLR